MCSSITRIEHNKKSVKDLFKYTICSSITATYPASTTDKIYLNTLYVQV